jgi:hypothetical protein
MISVVCCNCTINYLLPASQARQMYRLEIFVHGNLDNGWMGKGHFIGCIQKALIAKREKNTTWIKDIKDGVDTPRPMG